MKRELILLTVGCAMAWLSGCRTATPVVPAEPMTEKSIVVIYDNDVHCGIEGYAKMAGLRDAVSDTALVAMVSSGDYLQGGTVGALSHGQYVADVMRHMRYDALTLGNHEFDYGVPTLLDLTGQIGAPVTCVNLRDMQGNLLFEPFVMKQMGEKRVAFVGVVTPTTMATEAYSFFDKDDNQLYDLAIGEVYGLVQQRVDEARRQGADYVVVISHLGEVRNDLHIDSHGLVAATNGIDAVLDGHSHSVVPRLTLNNKDGKPVIISQTGTKLANIGKLVIMPNGRIDSELVSAQEWSRTNPEVQLAVDSINTLMSEVVNRKICRLDHDLRILDERGRQAVRMRETNAGDIVADAFRVVSGAEIAMANGGGIRSEAKAGELTYGEIIAFLPYDNYVEIVEVTGRELLDVLELCTSFIPSPDGDFPQVSGMRFTVDASKKAGRVSDLEIMDRVTGEYYPVDLERTYELATTDYNVTGGGFRGMLKRNRVVKPSLYVYYECLIQYVTEHLHGHIGGEYEKEQGRINIVNR